MLIRPVAPDDFADILRLNDDWVHVTSALDSERLAHLHEHAAYHRVCVLERRVAGFLLALGPGVPYASPNYRWFCERFGGFLYIDRVVVSAERQQGGVGAALYADLVAFAREQGVSRLVCEVDVEPFNAASDAFHVRQGFAEVGTQWIAEGTKRVSLRELVLG